MSWVERRGIPAFAGTTIMFAKVSFISVSLNKVPAVQAPPVPVVQSAIYEITSITHYEYLQAKESGPEILAFLLAEAVAAGIWPPKGGPDWLTTMQSTIFVPTKFSPPH